MVSWPSSTLLEPLGIKFNLTHLELGQETMNIIDRQIGAHIDRA